MKKIAAVLCYIVIGLFVMGLIFGIFSLCLTIWDFIKLGVELNNNTIGFLVGKLAFLLVSFLVIYAAKRVLRKVAYTQNN